MRSGFLHLAVPLRRCAYAIAGCVLLAGGALAQETVVIGGAGRPAVEVDLGALDQIGQIPSDAPQRARAPRRAAQKKSSTAPKVAAVAPAPLPKAAARPKRSAATPASAPRISAPKPQPPTQASIQSPAPPPTSGLPKIDLPALAPPVEPPKAATPSPPVEAPKVATPSPSPTPASPPPAAVRVPIQPAPVVPPTPAPAVAAPPTPAPPPAATIQRAAPQPQPTPVPVPLPAPSAAPPTPPPTAAAPAVQPPPSALPVRRLPDTVASLPPANDGPPSETPVLRVEFDGTTAGLSQRAEQALARMADDLSRNEERLQIKAFAAGTAANPSSARRLSLSRALAVRAYLIERGLRSTRIDVRALGVAGDGGPADRVDVVVLGR